MRIALYLNNLDEEYQLALYRSVSTRAKELGMDVLCIQQERLSEDTTSILLFPSQRFISVDGVLVLSSVLMQKASRSILTKFKKAFDTIPVISIGTEIEDIPSIAINVENSMQELMEHLLKVHHYEHFLYLGGPQAHPDNITREAIFTKAIQQAHEENANVTCVKRYAGFNEYLGMSAIEQFIEQHADEPVDVIVSANDIMAIGALRAIKTQHDERWAHCAVTGFDDIPAARLERPALTTIRQPTKQMGIHAVETIYKLINRQPIEQVIHVDSSLIIRNSCKCTGIWNDETASHGSENGLQDYISQIQRERIKAEQIQQHASFFSQQLNSVSSIDEVTELLRGFLGNIGIQFFYLILFPPKSKQLSDKALLTYQKNGVDERVYNPGLPISLKSFFSSEIFSTKKDSSSLVMHYLTAGSATHGLFVYESDSSNHPQMCSISILLGYTINRLRFLEDEKNRSLELEKEVGKRTQQIVKANQKLAEESQRRISVEAEVLKISEQERMRFSMDLHDDICQRLAGISMMCKGMSNIQPQLQELSTLIDETLHRTRQYAHDSFPMELDSLGMNEAIGNLCHTVQSQCENKTTIDYYWEAPEQLGLDRAQNINIYRIVQEALHNVMKHASATKVTVSIVVNKKTLVVTVQDNGKGNPLLNKDPTVTKMMTATKHGSLKSAGIGLRSMYYRADQIGAKCSIHSETDKGTTVQLKLPLLTN